MVHAIGFSDKNELRGKFVDTSLENFLLTMNVSAYSFVAVAKRARAMMPEGGLKRQRIWQTQRLPPLFVTELAGP